MTGPRLLALVSLLALAGCVSTYDPQDTQGPPASFEGLWTGEKVALRIHQDVTHVTAQWIDKDRAITRVEGDVEGRVLLGSIYTRKGSSASFALTIAKDGKSALYNKTGYFGRAVLGPSSEEPLLAGHPSVQGGLVAQWPVGPDGAALPTPWGAPPRRVLVYLEHLVDRTGRNRPAAVYVPLEEPRKVAAFLLDAAKHIPELDLATLRRARGRSAFHAPQSIQIDGKPAWALLAPWWPVGSSRLASNEIVAEIYHEDPASDALAAEVYQVATVGPDWKAHATGSLLVTTGKTTGIRVRFEGGRWIAETFPVPEPPIAPLLQTKEETGVALGRWRNRVLIEAKEKTLPKLLAAKKTSELTDFATELEKRILDLTHEKELSKDEAQALVEKNQAADEHGLSPDALRELALVYQERIEIAKAILAAVREEITNRGR